MKAIQTPATMNLMDLGLRRMTSTVFSKYFVFWFPTLKFVAYTQIVTFTLLKGKTQLRFLSDYVRSVFMLHSLLCPFSQAIGMKLLTNSNVKKPTTAHCLVRMLGEFGTEGTHTIFKSMDCEWTVVRCLSRFSFFVFGALRCLFPLVSFRGLKSVVANLTECRLFEKTVGHSGHNEQLQVPLQWTPELQSFSPVFLLITVKECTHSHVCPRKQLQCASPNHWNMPNFVFRN